MARRRQFSRSTARRLTGWSEGPGDFTTLQSITVSSVGLVGQGAVAAQEGLTVVRIRGVIGLTLTAADAALSGFRGAFGICRISENAFGIGVTAIPSPIIDRSWDGWMWHQHYYLMQAVVFSAQIAGGSALVTIPIDTKAMRKVPVSDVIVLMGEHIESGTAVMNVMASTRLLSKLP